MAYVMEYLSSSLPEDAILSNGAGNYTVWLHRFFRYRRPFTQLAPQSGAMGFGLPAAIAAKLRFPDRLSICFAGDGCFLMYPQELATAVQFEAPVITLLMNNGMYGTIRMHQEKRFPGRIKGTDLVNPDFVALAKSFGAFAHLVERTEDFSAAFQAAVRERPAGAAGTAGRPRTNYSRGPLEKGLACRYVEVHPRCPSVYREPWPIFR